MTDLTVGTGAIPAAGTLTGAEILVLSQSGAAKELTLANLQYVNAVAGGVAEWIVASNDRAFKIGQRSSTHASGELCYLIQSANIPMAFFTNGAERLRILGNGRVGIGTITPGAELEVADTAGDNDVRVNLRYNGASAPSQVGASTSQMFVDTGGNIPFTIYTNLTARWQVSASGHILSQLDNSYDVGGASNRVRVVYAGTGTINTSDEREKTWRGAMSAAELRAARAIIDELGFYQWIDAIEEKGARKARYHFGVRAQRVFAAFQAEKLDPSRYAFLCYDKWDQQTRPVIDEDGEPTGKTEITLEAGDRYGIRPDQLALFLIAAQEQRLAALEGKLAN